MVVVAPSEPSAPALTTMSTWDVPASFDLIGSRPGAGQFLRVNRQWAVWAAEAPAGWSSSVCIRAKVAQPVAAAEIH